MSRIIVTADVTQRIDVERLRDEAIAAFDHVDVWDHPVAEVYTNPASAELARRYFEDVARFESETRDRS